MALSRRLASITVSSYVPLEESAVDTLVSILAELNFAKAGCLEEVKVAIAASCIDEKKARKYSKYKRARKVRLSIKLEEIPPARGFKKRKRKSLLLDSHVDSLPEQVEDNSGS